jgi:hypothetical protein
MEIIFRLILMFQQTQGVEKVAAESSGERVRKILKLVLRPLAVDAVGAAQLLGISPRHFRSLDAAGRVPRGMRFGKSKRWRVRELTKWLDAGGPSREEWERGQGGLRVQFA